MHKKVVGIVVSEYPYLDNSKIINVFTENGEIGIIAKGAKKLKSPFFASTNRFTYGVFNIFYKENGLSTLVDASILDNYTNIKKDINRVYYTTFITELVLKVYKHDNDKNVFTLYVDCLDKINKGYDASIITNILRLKLLTNLGIKPEIDSCVECGSKDNIITISSYLGGFVCKDCYKNEVIVSPRTIRMIRALYYVDINKISKIDISDDIKKELDLFINDYYDRYSGIYLKSKILFDTLE